MIFFICFHSVFIILLISLFIIALIYVTLNVFIIMFYILCTTKKIYSMILKILEIKQLLIIDFIFCYFFMSNVLIFVQCTNISCFNLLIIMNDYLICHQLINHLIHQMPMEFNLNSYTIQYVE